MTRTLQIAVLAAVCVFSLWGVAGGWFAPLDGALRDMRFNLTSRPASGEIVFIDVGAGGMQARSARDASQGQLARAIDIMVAQGATTIILDIPALDIETGQGGQRLLASLAAAEGRVHTVAVQREAADGTQRLVLPDDRAAALATPVAVDATTAAGPGLERYSTRMLSDGWVISSMATALNPQYQILGPQTFLVDFSIDLSSVPRIALADVTSGRLAPEAFLGRQVVVGHPSYDQQSSHAAPRYGVLSTPAMQLLAAETIRQERMLRDMSAAATGAIIILGALVFILLRPRMALQSAILGSAAYAGVIEFTALVLQVHSALLLDTAGVHIAQLGFIVAAFWHELEDRGRSLDHAAQERDSIRGLLERVVADNFDGVVVIDRSGTIRAASKLAETLIGPNLIGSRYEAVLPEAFRRALEGAIGSGLAMDEVAEMIIPCNGVDRVIEFVVTLSEVDGADQSAIGRVACLTFRDVSERKSAADRLAYLAEHDPLTGAASRVKLVKDLSALLSLPTERAKGASVFLIGLSRLKTVNDTLGHAYGDALLKQVVARLGLMGPLCVARLEGNAFAVLRPGLVGSAEGAKFADRLIEEIARPYHLDGHHAIVGARVGMSDSDLSGFNPEAIITHANLALSIASDQPGNTATAFAANMDTRIKIKQDMEVALRAALSNGEFRVHYQPQVDLETRRIVGVEALARWVHPQLGNVPPAEFIPVAEHTGLIIDLGRWILRTATREVAGWATPLRVSVNISPMQFDFGDIVGDLRAALEQSGLPPGRLCVEITESLLVAETSNATEKLAQMRAMGVSVALDDFGTGYSSLSYLGRLPVDTIKIDQSFVRGLPEDLEASAIVRTVLMLSESLGKHVIAEGIETQDQAWLLRLAGCRTGQGFLFARPGPAEEIVAILDDEEADRLARDLRS
ncbi:EAL domain-containing protein [Pelagibacterium lacus]|uniref:EAL domain-containing protein n=1 Tax=Pelagibacterium lacus TaxID=2282655 RepID=A0A369W1A0_9HYPH|nr:EAL domain-containing protein [Pelagibacterium lacus]RDE08456.1 EAL domain-containing protein [Pelagibacterium lacus]